MEIVGKIAIVTGGASGIGEGLARRFADDGAAAVVIADLDLQGATRVAGAIGSRAIAMRCDVGCESDIQDLVCAVRERFGRIDVFVSNAGLAPRKGGVNLEDAVWEKMWRVHCMAHVWAARAVMPEMQARGEGYFLVTASAAGLLNLVESAPYGVSKHATVAIAEWLRIAYGRSGVVVSCLCPQAVESGMTKDGAGSAGDDELLTAGQVASVVVEAMRVENFLILSHETTGKYLQFKMENYDRWLGGMQKLHLQHGG